MRVRPVFRLRQAASHRGLPLQCNIQQTFPDKYVILCLLYRQPRTPQAPGWVYSYSAEYPS